MANRKRTNKREQKKRIDFNKVLLQLLKALQALLRLCDPETIETIKDWAEQF
jgi:hypothetical protein